ncbi:MAG: NADH:flavin oxidoreductase [Thermoguttaceae bacterium]
MFTKIVSLTTPAAFTDYVKSLGIELPFAAELPSPGELALAQSVRYAPKNSSVRTVGNRWAILPMEGWDCNTDGAPSELTRRRWLRFGTSGAKLIYGCEAAAVMRSGKSNTRQLVIKRETAEEIAALRSEVVSVHGEKFGRSDDLVVGLQLTHSGRYSHPNDDAKLEPVIAYRNPFLDERFGNASTPLATDAMIDDMIAAFIEAGRLAAEAGFDFVDIKHAHGYFGHELLSAYDRAGKFGGSLENRSRFFREIAGGLRKVAPNLDVSLRLSLFDFAPFVKDANGVGVPMTKDYEYALGGDGTGTGYDLTETFALIRILRESGVSLLATTVGSPYYNPHIQRPAAFPVADGYSPPEDPLCGVARQIAAVAQIKREFPELLVVGSGYSYLQDWLPNVAEAAVAAGMTDFVGIGRMVLSYPDICDDVLQGRPLQRKRICRTLGDCTNAPRNGMVSGCYPLDDFYATRDEAKRLREIKKKR